MKRDWMYYDGWMMRSLWGVTELKIANDPVVVIVEAAGGDDTISASSADDGGKITADLADINTITTGMPQR